ncbi:MAG: hypothetical protein LUB61_00875 [Eggerthellaceae bacterium]|nr:hypothetical protein [Eggerthellaceae bacterium]
MAIVAGIMVPHPPLIVPAVGRGSEKQVQKTIDSYHEAARFIVDHEPDVLVISSPHAPMFRDGFYISTGEGAKGDFGQFGAPREKFSVTYDQDFESVLAMEALEEDIPVSEPIRQDKELDHGTMVPLYFIREAYREKGLMGKDDIEIPVPIVRIGLSMLPLETHEKLGEIVSQVGDELGRKVGYIASGDLSHKLTYNGPYGFDPAGPEYDEKIMDVMGRAAFDELLEFPDELCDDAAECGHRSFVIMGGAFGDEELDTHELSHEPTTGVGYGVCTYEPVG